MTKTTPPPTPAQRSILSYLARAGVYVWNTWGDLAGTKPALGDGPRVTPVPASDVAALYAAGLIEPDGRLVDGTVDVYVISGAGRKAAGRASRAARERE